VVSERSQARVATAIRELATNHYLRERLSRAARVAAFKNHDANIVSTRFQTALCESVWNRTSGCFDQSKYMQENQRRGPLDTSSSSVPHKEDTLA